MAATWTTHRERGHPTILRLFTKIALMLGRPIARLMLHPIVIYFVFVNSPAHAASNDYLRRVLGRTPRFVERYRHVHCFASVVLDRLYLLNDRHRLFDIDVAGHEVMRALMADRNGAFVIGAHIGSFEAVRVAGRVEEDLRVSMVMYEDNAQYVNDVMAAINPKLARAIIPLGRVDSMLRVKQALDSGGLVGMLADRTLDEDVGTSAVREVALLGGTVAIPTGPFRMAAMLRRPVIFIVGLYRGGNRYEVRYEALHDFSTIGSLPREERGGATKAGIDAAIARYVERLEHYCRVAPYNWFNFFDYWGDATARVPQRAACEGQP